MGFSEIDLYKINKLYNCPQAGMFGVEDELINCLVQYSQDCFVSETTLRPLTETESDMKSEARLSSKAKKQGLTGSASIAGSSTTADTNNLISVLAKVACSDKYVSFFLLPEVQRHSFVQVFGVSHY